MMTSSASANTKSFEVTPTREAEVTITRLFDAPPELVYEAMTRTEHVRRWWGCLGEGYSVIVCEIDLRVGGKWRFVNRHPHGEAAFHGEYLELDPPDRTVHTEIFEDFPDSVSTVTTTYAREGGKTRVTAVIAYESGEVREMVLGTGMAHGAGLSYDRLEDLLAELQRN